MKYGYRERRTLYSADLRALCIAEDWYTGGTNKEYAKLMDMTEKDNITTDDIVEIATDIAEHSTAAIEKFKRETGLELSDFYTYAMFLIEEKCHTFFEEV